MEREATLTHAQIVEAVIDAQAELQTPLGFYRCTNPVHGFNSASENYDPVIEDRLTKTLARLHKLLDDLGSPMYDPATHPDVPAPSPEAGECWDGNRAST